MMKAESTKRKMKDSYLEMTHQMPAHKISITNVVAQAKVSRGTFYTHYENLRDMIADIGNDILQDFRQIAESCSPYASLRPGDRPRFERMAWYIQENCSTIQLLLSPDGDPEFFQKWVEQFQQMLYRRLEDGNVHASPDLDRILYFLAQNSVRMIVDALPQQPIPIILQALEVTDLIMQSLTCSHRPLSINDHILEASRYLY